jgi:hypothetical protein
MLSEVLRSGEYTQGNGMLFYMDRGVQKNCCLGVMECEMGMTFQGGGYDHWRDNFGGTEMPKHLVLESVGLDQIITDEEIAYIEDTYGTVDVTGGEYRAHMLATMNDDGLTFDEIAAALVDLGWDVDLDEGRQQIAKHLSGVTA